MSAKKTLIVPMKVHAIYQGADSAVVGPEMDFESLPYFDKELNLDLNPDVPYLAESVISRPFEDTNFLLKRGVHLNWDFPRFLKRTKYGAKEATEFPAVPTRWLVSRFAGNSKKPDQQWIVESDALLTNLKGAKIYDMAQTGIDVDIHSGERPYSYMGRVETLDDWIKRKGGAGEKHTSWKSKHNKKPLTALGWGSPSFDVFYPNCRGAFGFYDPAGKDAYTYKVVGWYEDISDDYWLYYLKTKRGKWGFADIDALSHLDSERKAELKREQFEKQVLEDLGVELPYFKEATHVDKWDRMLCCGESTFLEEKLTTLAATQVLYAMGNTPIEALSAMIAEKANVNEGTGPIRDKLEDSLSAIVMGDRLKSLKLDIGPKFREFRHADEFMATGGGLRWVIEKIDDNPDKTPSGEHGNDKKLPPPLPESVLPLLHDLNEVQREYDRIARELESCRLELYADWYRYMHAAYPPPGETEEYVEPSDLRAMIQAGSLQKVKELKKILGGLKDAENAYDSGLAGKIEIAKENLQEELKKIQEELKKINDDIKKDEKYVEKFHWEVQHCPAPRFWEPAPPALVIATPRPQLAGKPTQQKDENKDTSGLETPLACEIFSDSVLNLSAKSGFSVETLFTEGKVKWTIPEKYVSTDLPVFRAEWHVEVFPVATMHPVTKSSGMYDPDFIKKNYLLGENEPDLDDNATLESPLSLAKAGSIYTGSTYVNQKLDDRYRSLLKKYCDLQSIRKETLQTQSAKIQDKNSQEYKRLAGEKKQLEKLLKNVKDAEKFLDGHDLLVVTLNGFNSALLQRHESIQLNPADPLGFADYQAFAQDVADTLKNNFKGLSPDPHAPFMPIRSGGLRVITLRLVDIFGRIVELEPSDVSTALSMEVPGHGDWVRLPPRLAQAARWNFRFLQARTEQQSGAPTESQSHQGSTPVHGWIVPNLLDRSLDFFGRNGRRLGSILRVDQTSRWQPEKEGQLFGHMQQIVDWITGKGGDFQAAFIEDIEEAMDNIHPDDREGQSAFSVLMGRPMAVVQLGVELELKGLPAVNNSWDELYRDLQRPERSTDGFEQVKFPYRIGEYRQRNDGLVGYWAIDEKGKLSENFSVNDAISASILIDKFPESTGDNWLDGKNKEWRTYDEKGRTLFEFLSQEKDKTIKKQDIVQPYLRKGSRVWEVLKTKGFLQEEKPYSTIRHYSEAGKLSISAAENMQQFVALMDPHGAIHLSSGIQPVKAIQLPEQFIKDALNRIEMAFLAAPVLSPEGQLQLSLPKEQEYTWLWRERNQWPTRKGEATAENEIVEEEIKRFRTVANFPDRVVLREGKLVLKHKPQTEETK